MVQDAVWRFRGLWRRGLSVRGDRLTPQERQIAVLAAAGLTNKEIGQQLFLSHRTVGAHLYQIFPKLGITTGSAARRARIPAPERHGENRS
jgi:DNA-binding NarL/FixJ family response regulator